MSFRLRLTIWSTLIMGIVFGLFGVLAYVTISDQLYSPLDKNLLRQAQAEQLYLSRFKREAPQLSTEPLGAPTYSIFTDQGAFISGTPLVPLNEAWLQQVVSGHEALGTMSLPEGPIRRVRVYLQPLYINGYTYVLQAATPLDVPDQIISQVREYLIIAEVILIVVAAVGSYVLSGRTLRVVNSVTTRARQIEGSQDLTQRIPEPATDDEIGVLVKTFNQMLARLDAAFVAQRRFVADSSHELRTPLTVIKGNLHLLKRATDGTERAELISITEAEISRLNRMVNDLLYMAQVQAGHDVKPVLRTVELDSLMLDVFALARSMAATKDQKVILVHEDIATTTGDRDQLQHLLLNLVDNAVKYAPPRTSLTLGLWADDGWARIEVGDMGPGIDSGELPLLFERFFRSPEARQSEREGAGLGLAIVKSIAEAHGGRVEVYSRVGEGTTFRVWLPTGRSIAPVAPEPAKETPQRVGAGRIIGVPVRARRTRTNQEETWGNT